MYSCVINICSKTCVKWTGLAGLDRSPSPSLFGVSVISGVLGVFGLGDEVGVVL